MLPFPDREIWKPWMRTQLDAEFAVLLWRGCPYNCTYCSNHALRKVAGGKYTRLRSPGNILEEIVVLHEKYPLKRIYLEVETIAVQKTWAIELCSQLEAFNVTIDNPLYYACNFRISPQSVDEKLFIAFKKANFYRIKSAWNQVVKKFGVKCSSETIQTRTSWMPFPWPVNTGYLSMYLT